MGLDFEFWSNRRVLVTGHTGFKGAWLSLWLSRLGAKVFGYALAPSLERSLYAQAGIPELLEQELIGDIRHPEIVKKFVDDVAPECVFHLAAQAEVMDSYRAPVETFSVNVIGTAMLLDVLRGLKPAIPIVVVTSDKCYRNVNQDRAFSEIDALGVGDPYSTSKACQEFVAESMARCFFGRGGRLATARAGNIIGGGDWATSRIVPDVIRAWQVDQPVQLRFPNATRPWQYILDVLTGYTLLLEWLAKTATTPFCAFNFGPDSQSSTSVLTLVEKIANCLQTDLSIEYAISGDHEASFLRLDSVKSKSILKWEPLLSLDMGIEETINWYREVFAGADPNQVSLEAIERHIERLRV